MPPRTLVAAALVAAACSTAPQPPADSRYAPTQSVLEMVALLRLHVEDDTYRFPPARDFTGKNVYRAVFERLESLEQIHAGKFGSGYMTDVLWFSKARALERLAEYDLAALHYRRTAELDSPLVEAAVQGHEICEALSDARRIRPPPDVPLNDALETFRRRGDALQELRELAGETHYRYVLQEELERVDRERADYFSARSGLEPSLDAVALQQQQEVAQTHRESKLHPRHLLALADQYADMSRRNAARFPATGLDFDPAVFDDYAFGATRLYEAVSHRDGAIEKLEAVSKLEAFLAFTLQIYDERIPR
ncbi:MAG: hypothetical protein J4G09_03865 [Proteobacteria bacterium]|nr:hypothetical protein [Pseudomonadota bacterium]